MTSTTNLDWQLAGKTIIVTGASSGMGAATAVTLGAAGASVVLVARDAGRLRSTAEAVVAAGGRALAVTADLADYGSGRLIVDATVGTFGGIDGIVNNASLFQPGPLENVSLEGLEQQWRVNVAAPIALTQAALPHLGPGSTVVFISSTVAHAGFAGYSEYTATKGAVEAAARALAVELAPRGIRVNTVAPGFVRTPMVTPALEANPELEGWLSSKTPLGRIGEPNEIASAVAFLLSPLSAYVVGASLVADGGWIAQ